MTADPEQNLRDSLEGLAGVLTGDEPLAATLARITAFAVCAIPGADGAGVMLLERHGRDTRVAGDELVAAVDAVQYGLGEGPGLLAVESRTTQRSGSLGGESRWPRFGPRAGRLGVHSVLSLPLLITDRAVGVLNVYGRPHEAFDDRSVTVGERFARPAAVTASHALLLEESRRVAAQLQEALVSRAVIDQAIGIVMSRTGKNAEEAFAEIRDRSQRDHVKLSEVAARIVDRVRARYQRTQ
ncbi:transcriptional regulator [Kineosporia sp. NBRC 101677]|uniref:GAF and ANTAR domain-containing protein n=1 Tax=Kineosporia sp. NBRC 101677 TaxID=3032197 RepID=UPI0024A141DF|nr:GAF and ANTAR domain-containing protein [Kineosporia sp. NBRC 101677]GLY14570.1 transcriptional regulator [Kineosporia sp. NBRC 101677]